jgi:hypothetical protein
LLWPNYSAYAFPTFAPGCDAVGFAASAYRTGYATFAYAAAGSTTFYASFATDAPVVSFPPTLEFFIFLSKFGRDNKCFNNLVTLNY